MFLEKIFEEKIKEYIGKPGVHFGEGLQKALSYIKNGAISHLKLISEQLPEYDFHDESHSEKIIDIIESLLGEYKIRELSIYEIFFLYLAAYTHDCGMALPAWEIKLLISTEGIKEFPEDKDNGNNNDLKPPLKLADAITYVQKNAKSIYGDFSNVADFIFIKHDENAFIRDLAERLILYQEFRNGYSNQIEMFINENDKDRFNSYSEFLRKEFIRITHAERSAIFIENLEHKLIKELGGNWGGAITRDLANICRAHGESADFINDLETEASYFGDESANIQFVSLLLRIGDVIHFSYDRAPRTLFSERMIDSVVSRTHWKAKFQGLNYSITREEKNDEILIKYMLFCDEPNLYYFVHEYLDCVDSELDNFNSFRLRIEKKKSNISTIAKYMIELPLKVDRSHIEYNRKIFTPASNKGFVLEQNKIIQLLMSVGLYKNEDLLLRELYQNSLDACRLMISMKKQRNESKRGIIEFGLGERQLDGVKRKYIYCKDNGIGMSKRIIESYFLNIGNSYYNSHDFFRNSIKWGNNFKPVSKFGIGILSCFMVGDQIEVTTIPIDSEDQESKIRFAVNGAGQYFYYLNPDELDVEEIGEHGTIIKVFLNDNEKFNDDDIDNIEDVLFGFKRNKYFEQHKNEYKLWERNLLIIINKIVGLSDSNIDIQIKLKSNHKKLISWRELYPYNQISDEEQQELLFSDYFYMNDSYRPFKEYYKNIDMLDSFNVDISSNNFTFHTHITLPKKGIGSVDFRVLDFVSTIMDEKSNILVDGIAVGAGPGLSTYELSDSYLFSKNGVFNFNGKIRPDLSVDRTTTTEIPERLKSELASFPEIYINAIIKEISNYIDESELDKESEEVNLIWNYLMFKYSSMSGSIIENIAKQEKFDVVLHDLSSSLGIKQSLKSFIEKDKIEFEMYNRRNLNQVSMHVLIGKCLDADGIIISDKSIKLTGTTYKSYMLHLNSWESFTDFLPLIIKVDEWKGQYQEFDVVSNLWPYVPTRTYDAVCDLHVKEILGSRGKKVDGCTNSLTGIGHLRAPLINPSFGISTLKVDNYKKEESLVGRCDNIVNQFSLYEINDWNRNEENVDYFIFVYISPEKLSNKDLCILEDYKEKDPAYYKGVQEGWSILFMGQTKKTVIMPGIVKREDIIPDKKNSIWKLHNNKKYYFLDGTQVQPKD